MGGQVLLQEPIHTKSQSAQDMFLPSMPCEHRNLDIRTDMTKLADKIKTVDTLLLKHNVEQDNCGLKQARHCHSVVTRPGRSDDLKGLCALQERAKTVTEHRMIVNNQDASPTRHCSGGQRRCIARRVRSGVTTDLCVHWIVPLLYQPLAHRTSELSPRPLCA